MSSGAEELGPGFALGAEAFGDGVARFFGRGEARDVEAGFGEGLKRSLVISVLSKISWIVTRFCVA
jgi:hypothetical protein